MVQAVEEPLALSGISLVASSRSLGVLVEVVGLGKKPGLIQRT